MNRELGSYKFEESFYGERVDYTSKTLDEDTGLYYYNARWYDPNLGRFITEDPIKDGNNWYIYASNNPIMRIDPTGLADEYAGFAKAQAKSENTPRFTATLFRNPNSWLSANNEGWSKANVGLDVLVIENNNTKEGISIFVQSVANHKDYSVGNTIVSDFDLNAYSTSGSFEDLVLVVGNATTLDGTKINADGHELDENGNPMATGRWLGHEPPPYSGGCIIPATQDDFNVMKEYLGENVQDSETIHVQIEEDVEFTTSFGDESVQ